MTKGKRGRSYLGFSHSHRFGCRPQSSPRRESSRLLANREKLQYTHEGRSRKWKLQRDGGAGRSGGAQAFAARDGDGTWHGRGNSGEGKRLEPRARRGKRLSRLLCRSGTRFLLGRACVSLVAAKLNNRDTPHLAGRDWETVLHVFIYVYACLYIRAYKVKFLTPKCS